MSGFYTLSSKVLTGELYTQLNGVTSGNFVISSPVTVSTPLTIQSGVHLKVENGGTISCTADLTINGAFECGLYQCFTGSGSVVFSTGSVTYVHPEWWGASHSNIDSTAAFQSAMTAAISANVPVVLAGGTYYVNAVFGTGKAHLLGQAVAGEAMTSLKPYSAASPVITFGNDSTIMYGVRMANIAVTSLSADGVTHGTVGLALGSGAYECNFDNVSVVGSFSQYNCKIIPASTSAASKPISYVNFNNCRFVTSSGVSNSATFFCSYPDTYYTDANYCTAIYLNGCQISGPNAGSGFGLSVNGMELNIVNTYIQIFTNKGVALNTKYGTQPARINGANVTVDSSDATPTTVNIDRTGSHSGSNVVGDYIRGTVSIVGNISFDSGALVIAGTVATLPPYTVMAYPYIQGALFFNQTTNTDPHQEDSTIYRTNTAFWVQSQSAIPLRLSCSNATGYVSLESESRIYLNHVNGVVISACTTGAAANNSIFKNSADGKLYFKDNSGVSNALY